MTGSPGPLRRAARRGYALVSFTVWFGWQFLRANAVVVREILSPGDTVEPAIVEVPLRSRTPLEIASMTSLITLIPGTLALSLNEGDPPRIAVHGMHAADVDAFRARIHELETRILAVLRPAQTDLQPGDRPPGLRGPDAPEVTP
jgi:multicomponent Na+:H+ antiporter subunit E